MILWRISEHRALDGAGGLVVGGRWHSKGRRIVYTAESSALAMLEVLVHFGTGSIPPPFQLLEITVPDGLPSGAWPNAMPPAIETISAHWGDGWIDECTAPLARVPSAIAPKAFNWLINPAHPDAAGIKLKAASRWPWDKRLFK